MNIKKLRVKLLAAALGSVFAVLLILLAAVLLLNYRSMVAEADGTLAILAANGGAFPDAAAQPQPGADPGGGDPGRQLSPELPYESRYFTVSLSSDGAVASVNTGKIAAVDTASAITYAQAVLAGGKTAGFTDAYRYTVQTTESGTQVIFLDCRRSLDSFRTLCTTGCGVSAVMFASVFVLVALLSGRVLKPFAESYEKQKQFITDAGHELKTPLTIIDADAEVLQMDLGENEWLADIQSQTHRLAELTNALILLSRMEEAQPRLQSVAFPLSDAVEETAQSFQALAVTQGKTLTLAVQPLLTLTGDEGAIRRLVTILLDNAVKYTPAQGEIRLALEQQKNAVRLTVWNTAQAVDPAQLERLFDRFYRADASRSSQTGGYGLGLAIAAAIVRAHRGKISAATDDGRSLRITVTLPA